MTLEVLFNIIRLHMAGNEVDRRGDEGDLPRMESFWASIRDTHRFARNKLRELLLPTPGFVSVGDNYYSGWFYLSKGNYIYSVYRNIPSLPTLPPEIVKIMHSPYFLINKEHVNYWNRKAETSPFSMNDLKNLFEFPNDAMHPLYEKTRKLDPGQFTKNYEPFINDFWTQSKAMLDRKDPLLSKHIQDNILQIAVLERSGRTILRREGYWGRK